MQEIKDYGTKIVMDEEKILKKGLNLNEIYAKIDELAQKSNMIKKDKFTYVCKGNEQDLSNMGVFNMLFLPEYENFTRNVKEWLWLSPSEGVSDMINFTKQENEGIWES